MIAAPNAYFAAEEARQFGAEAQAFFSVWPYYPYLGLAGGMHSDTTFVAPDQIRGDYERTALEYWESDVLQLGIAGRAESPVLLAWAESNAAHVVVVYFRTAGTAEKLAAEPYVQATSSATYYFREYFQFKVQFTGRRCWATPTDDGNTLNAYATNGTGGYVSYAVPGPDNYSYCDGLIASTDFPVPDEDVVSGGVLSLDRSQRFGDFMAADHTLVLANPSGFYTPGRPEFLFVDDNYWYRKYLRIDFGYRRQGTRTWDVIRLYEGQIINWGPVVVEASDTGERSPSTVEVYSRDILGIMLDKRIGLPDEDGEPIPLIYGEMLLDAQEMGDWHPEDPAKECGFETGTTYGMDSTYESGGTLEVVTDEPEEGDYCLRADANGAGKIAYALLRAGSVGDFFGVAYVRFDLTPATFAAGNFIFMRVLDASDVSLQDFTVDADGNVRIGDTETDWVVTDLSQVWQRVAIWYSQTSDTIKAWVEGEEVLSWTGTLLTNAAALWVGAQTGATSEHWTVSFDRVAVWRNYYKNLFAAPGRPFDEIREVYEGTKKRTIFVPKSLPEKTWHYGAWGDMKYAGGAKVPTGDFALYPNWGAVQFVGTGDVPSDVAIKVVANSMSHPVDVIEDLVGKSGFASAVDTASFAAAKAATPGDVIGASFEDTTVADAIREACEKCLLDIAVDHGVVKIYAYDGTLGSAVWTVVQSDVLGLNQTINMEDIANWVGVKWGWYDRNKRLSYIAKDQDSIDLIGQVEEDIDYSWGSGVCSESSAMAKGKADLLLTRMSSPVDVVQLLFNNLKAARLELGDVITLDIPEFGDPLDYAVYGKEFDMDAKQVGIMAKRFLGEG